MNPYDPDTTPDGTPPAAPRKRRHYIRWTLAGLGALVLLFVVIGIAAGGSGKAPATASPPSSPAATTSGPGVQTVTFTDPNGVTCPPSQETNSGYCPGDDPAPTPTPAATYRALTARTWAQIAKDPDAHAGETYIVYGEVTQFDAATGQSAFRADVGGVRQYPDDIGYVSYPTNTVLDGDAAALSPVVQNDLFAAKVTVTGSLSYDTQIGGSTTVPELQVDSITVTGHASS
jgi:hypothetical protein